MRVLQGNCGVPQDKKRAWPRLLVQVPGGLALPCWLLAEVSGNSVGLPKAPPTCAVGVSLDVLQDTLDILCLGQVHLQQCQPR